MHSLSLGWFSCKRVSTKPQGSSSLLMSNTCDNYLSESKCVLFNNSRKKVSMARNEYKAWLIR